MEIKGKVGINMKNIENIVITSVDVFAFVVRNNNRLIMPK